MTSTDASKGRTFLRFSARVLRDFLRGTCRFREYRSSSNTLADGKFLRTCCSISMEHRSAIGREIFPERKFMAQDKKTKKKIKKLTLVLFQRGYGYQLNEIFPEEMKIPMLSIKTACESNGPRGRTWAINVYGSYLLNSCIFCFFFFFFMFGSRAKFHQAIFSHSLFLW